MRNLTCPSLHQLSSAVNHDVSPHLKASQQLNKNNLEPLLRYQSQNVVLIMCVTVSLRHYFENVFP